MQIAAGHILKRKSAPAPHLFAGDRKIAAFEELRCEILQSSSHK